MTAKVFINGHEGTTGLRIADRLAGREDISLISIDEDLRKDPAAVKECMDQADVAFFCLPDDASRKAAAEAGEDTIIIDASTAHRTAPGWAYGFPELSPAFRCAVAEGRRIAVPGCHATGCISLIYPLISAGVMKPGYPLSAFSLTGYSGGGKKMIRAYNDVSRPIDYDAPREYALGQTHKHLSEIAAVCGLDSPPVFTPIVGPFFAGMDVMVPLFPKLLSGHPSKNEIREIYRRQYAGTPFVSVYPDDSETYITANEKAGEDDMMIYVTGTDDRIVVHSVFDNLGKGASGAAVQCMNIVMGFPETEGLCIRKR